MTHLQVIGEDDVTMTMEPDPMGLQAEGRSFLLAAVSLSVAVYDLGFNLAVYGEVFFDKYITLWVIATAVILGSLVLPRGQKPIGFGGAFMLLLPGTYFLGAVLLTQGSRMIDFGIVGALFGVVSLLVALGTLVVFLAAVPYVMYMLAKILNPDLVQFTSWRYRLGLVGITAFTGIASVTLGLAHPLYLTCDDFTVSGNDRPSNCTAYTDPDDAPVGVE